MTTADFLIEDPFSGFSGEDKLKAHPKKFQKNSKNQLATSYYDDSKALLHLLPRVPPKTMDEIRATPERLSRIHTFNSLVDLLYELALQRKSDATLKNLHSMAQLKWLDGNTNADSNAPMNQEEAFAHSLCEEQGWDKRSFSD